MILALICCVHSKNGPSGNPPPPRTTLPAVKPSSRKYREETGLASFYASRYDGRPTASGETFHNHLLTAAHPYLVFGTRVRVTNLQNHHSVVVRINDRGPFAKGRVIDLSQAAARRIEMIPLGLAQVKLEILE